MSETREDDVTELDGALHSLTDRKATLLAREFDAFRAAITGRDAPLADVNDDRARRIRRWRDDSGGGGESVPHGIAAVAIQHEESTPLTDWWIEVPVFVPDRNAEDSLWCPATFPDSDGELARRGSPSDAAVVRRGDEWGVVVSVECSSI